LEAGSWARERMEAWSRRKVEKGAGVAAWTRQHATRIAAKGDRRRGVGIEEIGRSGGIGRRESKQQARRPALPKIEGDS
jgi:hypothetical protein